MDQPVLDSNIKIYSPFNRSCDCHSESSTVPAEDLYLGVFREFPSVAEQSSCRSTGSTSLPSYKLYLSFSPYSCLPSAGLFFTARLSLTCSLSYPFALSVSVSPCLGLPSSPSPHRPVCTGSPDMHHTY